MLESTVSTLISKSTVCFESKYYTDKYIEKRFRKMSDQETGFDNSYVEREKSHYLME